MRGDARMPHIHTLQTKQGSEQRAASEAQHRARSWKNSAASTVVYGPTPEQLVRPRIHLVTYIKAPVSASYMPRPPHPTEQAFTAGQQLTLRRAPVSARYMPSPPLRRGRKKEPPTSGYKPMAHSGIENTVLQAAGGCMAASGCKGLGFECTRQGGQLPRRGFQPRSHSLTAQRQAIHRECARTRPLYHPLPHADNTCSP